MVGKKWAGKVNKLLGRIGVVVYNKDKDVK